jgi:hypothetical protein
MMTEDELRARLQDASGGIAPQDDLLDTLAAEHARRHKRVRTGLIGGSVAAAALVVTVLGSLFAGGALLPIEPGIPGKDEVVKRAQDATDAADTMILSLRTDQGQSADGTRPPTVQSWALQSEWSARSLFPGRVDTTFRAPGIREDIDYLTRKVVINDRYDLGPDIVANVSGSGVGDPGSWLRDQIDEVRADGAEIHLAGRRMGLKFEVWLNSRTYLPTRAVFGSYTMALEWLPATPENRRLLEHTVPPDFPTETDGAAVRPTR